MSHGNYSKTWGEEKIWRKLNTDGVSESDVATAVIDMFIGVDTAWYLIHVLK